MDLVPTSVVAAVGCSAAAGKNPRVPLALVFLSLVHREGDPEPLTDGPLRAVPAALETEQRAAAAA